MDYVIEENIHEYVKAYSSRILKDSKFYSIDEGYKYNAVANFQKEFDLNAINFPVMLKKALSKGKNLVQSTRYYPTRMLIEFAEKNPEMVRKLLKALLDDKLPVAERIDIFINSIHEKFPLKEGQYYMDARFLGFFLAANNPDKYFYVKTKQYKKFAEMIGLDFKLYGSQGDKYSQMAELAEFTRNVLKESEDFHKVHNLIAKDYDYKDPSMSWGTLDFIYNVAERVGTVFHEGVKKRIDMKVRIMDMEQEIAENLLSSDEDVPEIIEKPLSELLEEARKFAPSNKEGYKESESNRRLRTDNNIQKERIKKIEGYRCQVCGFTFEYRNSSGSIRKYAEVDHIVDKSIGGTEAWDNLWVLCSNCHKKKTLNVITIDYKTKIVRENGKVIKIRDKHLKNKN